MRINTRQWYVTKQGITSKTRDKYFIPKSRILNDDPDYSIEQHMSEKNWVNMFDLKEALAIFRNTFERPKSK